jgi:hypothetical protein
LFFDRIQHPPAGLTKAAPVRVSREHWAGNGRIDLFIESADPQHRFCIAIENKIDADDQPEQLLRYYNFLVNTLKYTDEQIALIYLTKYGGDATEKSMPKQEQDRLTNRQGAAQLVIPKRDQRPVERQPPSHPGPQGAGPGRAIFNHHTIFLSMSTSVFEEEIYQYLTEPQNFTTAWEITQEFKGVQDRVYEEFWGMVLKKLSSLPDGFTVTFPNDTFVHPYSSIWIFPPGHQFVGIGVSGFITKVFLGVLIHTNHHKAKEAARNYLSAREGLFPNMKPTDWWFGRQDTPFNFGQIDDIEKILPANREATAQELVDLLKGFYEEYGEHLAAMEEKAKEG